MAITAYTGIGPVSGVTNTKGAYTQIVASTPYDSSRLFLIAEFLTPGQICLLLDLATGAAGSETVIVANLALHSGTDQVASVFASLNVQIPAGTRLAVRTQATTPSSTVTLHFYLDDRALAGLTNPVTYGAVTASSRGTQIDPGTSAGTKGAYTQLTASTTSRIDTLVACLTVSGPSTGPTTGTRWALDVATGASGSEVVLLPNLTVAANSLDSMVKPGVLIFPAAIPAGTRLAARCNCNITTATARLLSVTLLGMQEPATSSGGGATSVAYLG